MAVSRQSGKSDTGARKREQILEAASSLFGGRDLSLVTMDEVALRAGVAKGTLYNYFASKEDLYFSILTVRMNHLLAALASSFRDEENVKVRLRKFTVHTLMFLLKYPDFFRMMRKEEARPHGREGGEARRLRARLRLLLRGVLSRGMGEGSIRNVPLGLATEMILGAVEGAAFRYLEEGGAPRRGDVETDLFFDLIWRSVGVPERASEGALKGARVLITREEPEGRGLGAEIERLGGRPVLLPLLQSLPPRDPAPLHEAAGRLDRYAWILFASVRAVEALAGACDREQIDRLPPSVQLAAVGRSSAERVLALFGRIDLVPARKTGVGLAEALRSRTSLAGLRLLLPRAEEGRPELAELLREAGAEVEEVAVYRTVASAVETEAVGEALRSGEIAAVTFASGSAVRAFVERFGADLVREPGKRVLIVSIGPTTSDRLRSYGIEVDGEAAAPEMAELARAVARSLASQSGARADGEGSEAARQPEGRRS